MHYIFMLPFSPITQDQGGWAHSIFSPCHKRWGPSVFPNLSVSAITLLEFIKGGQGAATLEKGKELYTLF